jgi:hypothetical protein
MNESARSDGRRPACPTHGSGENMMGGGKGGVRRHACFFQVRELQVEPRIVQEEREGRRAKNQLRLRIAIKTSLKGGTGTVRYSTSTVRETSAGPPLFLLGGGEETVRSGRRQIISTSHASLPSFPLIVDIASYVIKKP